MAFKKATKKQSRLRMALCGPSGSGKTYTSLSVASTLGDKVAVIDTERGSASKYADEFDFDVNELDTFHPQNFINGIHEAEREGYDVLVIDSISHAWMGKDGELELVDKASARSQSKNSYFAWREVTPLHNALVDAILQSRIHIIVTMRSKTEYVVETDSRGKQVPKKIGLAPIQRDGMEYEFDIVGDMDFDNSLIITKSRCRALTNEVVQHPGEEMALTIKRWLTDGIKVPDAPTPTSGEDARQQWIEAVNILNDAATSAGMTSDELRSAGKRITGKADVKKWTLKEIAEVHAYLDRFAIGTVEDGDSDGIHSAGNEAVAAAAAGLPPDSELPFN